MVMKNLPALAVLLETDALKDMPPEVLEKLE